MKKGSSRQPAAILIEHRVRVGLRQRDVSPSRSRTAPSRAESSIIWSPLVGLDWQGAELALGADTWLRRGTRFTGYRSKDVVEYLSPEEKARCRQTRHWLHFTRAAQSPLSAAIHENAFLLALWIVRPTPTHIAVRFETSPDGSHHAIRVLDRFQWIRGQVASEVSTTDLKRAAQLFLRILESHTSRKPIHNALVLAFRGCVSRDWQAATLCFAASIAAVLRCSEKKPVLEELAAGFAGLPAFTAEKHGIGVEAALDSYKAAARLFEGSYLPDTPPSTNLEQLAQLSDVARITLEAHLRGASPETDA